ncbi:MAG: aminotransferase class I/II-fold pyridoxal phosphate-dependent enzyme, partial [bacterium]|nr:aminotransferase class I/II-fold pyridoxal phosphate-dependent enzyme [bacterium]
MTQITVPLTDVTLGEEEAAAAARVIHSGWVTMGAEVEAFEREFAAAHGAPHAVAVASGTAALHLAYQAAGLREGDEFLVPALTFVATLNAGLYLGARPVLVDCASEDDLTLSPADAARKLTPRTRFIVTMAYGGHAPDMAAIMALAGERGIDVVEDACHAPLARLAGRCLGTFGRAGTFSFFGNKNMSTGEGGMILTGDAELARLLRLMRSHGMTTVTWQRHQGH